MERPGVANAPTSNDGSTDGSGGSKTPSCGAVALLEKYSALNTAIDDARRRTAATRSRTESLNSQIEIRRSERLEMTSRKKTAEAEAAELGTKLKKSRCRAEEILQSRGDASRDRDVAKEELEQTHKRVENERDEFIRQRREFRNICKKIRLEAAALATKSPIVIPGNQSERDENGKPPFTEDILDFCASSSEEESGDEEFGAFDDTSTVGKRCRNNRKYSIDNDSELLGAITLARSASESRSDAKRGLDEAFSSREASSKRADDRARKLEQQRSQLERVRRDIEEMRREIEQLEREAREAREMGDGYERDACRRRKMTRDSNSGHSNYNTSRSSYNPSSRQGASFSRSSNPEDETYFTEEEHELTPPSQLCSSNRIGTSSIAARHRVGSSGNTPSPHTSIEGQGDGLRANPYQTPRSDSLHSNRHNSSSAISRHAPVSNPYARSTTNNSYASGKVEGRRASSALERQHPHRSGRIRTERRFGTALEIFCSGDSLGDEDGDENDHSRMETRTKSVLSEEEEEEEDELLHFTAFKKK